MAFAYDLIWQSAPPVSFYKNQTVLSLFKPTKKNCAQPNSHTVTIYILKLKE